MAYEKRGGLGGVFSVVGIIFGIFFLIGAVFLLVAWFSWRSGQEFAANGVDTMGRIDRLWQSTRECRDSSSDISRTCTDFNVGYVYTVDGTAFQNQTTTGSGTWATLEEGAEIMVRYLPADPGNSATSLLRDRVDADGGMGILAMVFGGIGGVFALGGGTGLVLQIRKARAGAWLRENGTARGAVVVSQEPTNVRVNGRMRYRITWTDDAGGKGQSQGHAQNDLPPVGSRITVYADPEGKQPSVWEGDSGTR